MSDDDKLFHVPEPALVVRVPIPEEYAHWEEDDDGKWWKGGKDDDELRPKRLKAAREYFGWAYGPWFVEMGYARVPHEVEQMVVLVRLGDEDQEAYVVFNSKQQAMTFKIAHTGDIGDEED